MFSKPRQPKFSEVDENFVSGITSLAKKYHFPVIFLWSLIKSLGVGKAFIDV